MLYFWPLGNFSEQNQGYRDLLKYISAFRWHSKYGNVPKSAGPEMTQKGILRVARNAPNPFEFNVFRSTRVFEQATRKISVLDLGKSEGQNRSSRRTESHVPRDRIGCQFWPLGQGILTFRSGFQQNPDLEGQENPDLRSGQVRIGFLCQNPIMTKVRIFLT